MLSLHSPQALLHVGFTQGVPVIVAVNTGTPRRNSELRSGAVLTARVRKVLELGPLSPTEVQSRTLHTVDDWHATSHCVFTRPQIPVYRVNAALFQWYQPLSCGHIPGHW